MRRIVFVLALALTAACEVPTSPVRPDPTASEAPATAMVSTGTEVVQSSPTTAVPSYSAEMVEDGGLMIGSGNVASADTTPVGPLPEDSDTEADDGGLFMGSGT